MTAKERQALAEAMVDEQVWSDQRKAIWTCLAERDALLAVTLAYEQWEADLILSREAWQGGAREYPELTKQLWDRLMEIQAMRDAAKHKATGGEG